MKVRLAFRDRDLDPDTALPPNADALAQDLGLEIVLTAMAAGDKYVHEIARRTILTSLTEPAEICYRQAVLADCLAHPALVRELYAIAVAAVDRERGYWMYSARQPESLLRRSTALLGHLLAGLRRMRQIATSQAGSFDSEGFGRLFGELGAELDDAFLASVEAHLERLEFRDGVRLSATLGAMNDETRYVLRRRAGRSTWRERIGLPDGRSYTWELDPRDMAGGEALGALRGRGIALAASALGESVDHVMGYFAQLRAELAFYVGSLNLRDLLAGKGEPICMPDPAPSGRTVLSARGVYDASLSIALGSTRAVGSDVDADDRALLVVTGANRGGKSTFLRSIGLGQLLMQAGMFVPAVEFRADVRRGLFTHFKREEDPTLRSGKLDEELSRMSGIVDRLGPGSMVLFNESFASTNEREGAEIASGIVRALIERDIKVGYVTHMYELARELRADWEGRAAFLRAERLADGQRTFRVVPGEPLPTSHGQDIYERVFEPTTEPV